MTSDRCLSVVRHTALVCAALAFSVGSVSAQITATPEYSSSLSGPSVDSSSSSVEATNAGAVLPSAPDPNGEGGGQYDNRTRPGGGRGAIMSHLTYEVGGGFNAPTDDSSPYISWGGNITVGAGYRWNRNVSLNLEYQYIDSKLPGAIIAEAGASGGYDHIWSFTLNPMYEVNPKSSVIFYGVGGGGFYRKVTSFTDPQQGVYCDYFGYCYGVTQNVVVGHFSSNQGGWSAGGGIEHRFAGWNGDGKMKVFAEARYLDVMSPAVVGVTPNGLGVTTVGEGTKIVPVTVGFRW